MNSNRAKFPANLKKNTRGYDQPKQNALTNVDVHNAIDKVPQSSLSDAPTS